MNRYSVTQSQSFHMVFVFIDDHFQDSISEIYFNHILPAAVDIKAWLDYSPPVSSVHEILQTRILK